MSRKKKEEGTFYYKNISGEGIISHYSLILIEKNRRRVKLQSLQFYLNSKTIKLQRVKTVINFAEMVITHFFSLMGAVRGITLFLYDFHSL